MTAEHASARHRLAAAGALLALALGGLFAPAAGGAARVLNIDDTGKLRLLNASGSVLQEEGPATGTLLGTVKVRLTVHATITAVFTITARGGGSIAGSGSAMLHSSQRYSSFGGSLSVERGTGRYAHARGAGRLYGVIDRRTHALTVQTVGQLHY
jgi:hypothetical protein